MVFSTLFMEVGGFSIEVDDSLKDAAAVEVVASRGFAEDSMMSESTVNSMV